VCGWDGAYVLVSISDLLIPQTVSDSDTDSEISNHGWSRN